MGESIGGSARRYATPVDGLPPQHALSSDRATVRYGYTLIPRGVQRAIVTSFLPGWRHTRLWIIARPIAGFSDTFSHYLMALAPGGGSDAPEPDARVESVLFVTAGHGVLRIDAGMHELRPGHWVYLPPGADWSLRQRGETTLHFHWIRKCHEAVPGLATPEARVAHDDDTPATSMPDTEGRWATTRFVDPEDLRHDMHVNIVTFRPGASIPFMETHVMEHGIYVLEGKAVYRLNDEWVEVEAGDFMWLRAFCPQACTAAGPGDFRYLLYKDVNRHVRFP